MGETPRRSSVDRVTRQTLAEFAAVAAGGVVGTGLRWGLDVAVPHGPDGFPVSTVVTNVVGTFVLALLVSTLWRRGIPVWLRAGLGPGLLGTYTTFSAITASTVTLSAAGEPLLAMVTVSVSVLGGILAGLAGFGIGHRIPAARHEEYE